LSALSHTKRFFADLDEDFVQSLKSFITDVGTDQELKRPAIGILAYGVMDGHRHPLAMAAVEELIPHLKQIILSNASNEKLRHVAAMALAYHPSSRTASQALKEIVFESTDNDIREEVIGGLEYGVSHEFPFAIEAREELKAAGIVDAAMLNNRNLFSNISEAAPGGIDLNSANLNFQIKRDGRGVPLPLAQQDMAQLSRIQGFDPVIMEIKAVTALPMLSELQAILQTKPA